MVVGGIKFAHQLTLRWRKCPRLYTRAQRPSEVFLEAEAEAEQRKIRCYDAGFVDGGSNDKPGNAGSHRTLEKARKQLVSQTSRTSKALLKP